jgi:hypothetical protein
MTCDYECPCGRELSFKLLGDGTMAGPDECPKCERSVPHDEIYHQLQTAQANEQSDRDYDRWKEQRLWD